MRKDINRIVILSPILKLRQLSLFIFLHLFLIILWNILLVLLLLLSLPFLYSKRKQAQRGCMT